MYVCIYFLGSVGQFSLASAPVIFHLQEDAELLDYLQQFSNDLLQVSSNRIRNCSVTRDYALDKVRIIWVLTG